MTVRQFRAFQGVRRTAATPRPARVWPWLGPMIVVVIVGLLAAYGVYRLVFGGVC